MNTNFPTSQELKARARQLRQEHAPRPTQVTLLYWLLGSVLVTAIGVAASWLLPASSDTLSAPDLFLSLLLGLYGSVLTYGYSRWILWTSRGRPLENNALLDGFSEVGRVIMARVWTVVLLIGWAFLISIAMTVILLLLSNVWNPFLLFVLALLTVGGCYLAIYLIALRYELVDFLLAEFDQLTGVQAVRRSAELMQGQIGRMFRLKLSFLGWHLLEIGLVLGVSIVLAYPQVMAYINMISELNQYADWKLILYAQYYSQAIQEVLYSVWGRGAALLISLPFLLYVMPYQRLAEAEFYTSLIRPQPQPQPETPPWEER